MPRQRGPLLRELIQCARSNDAESAISVFEKYGGVETRPCWSAAAYNTLLSMLIARPDDAARVERHLLDSGVAIDETTVSPAPRVRPAASVAPRPVASDASSLTFEGRPLRAQVTLRVRTLARCGEWERAFEVLRAARAAGTPLRLRSYSALLRALCREQS